MENIRILCIDDEEEILSAMKAILDSQGWQGDYAQDLNAGLNRIDRNKPDIIIIDYHLPMIDGISGTRILRRRLPDVPILVFTIEDSQMVADQFLEAGASDFAIKPLHAPDLIARIRLHIRLLRHKNEQTGNVYVEKSISTITLSLISDYMAGQDSCTVDEIASGTGLAYQTVYRYIQYMQENGIVSMEQSYGKIGRPKRRFCLIGRKGEQNT